MLNEILLATTGFCITSLLGVLTWIAKNTMNDVRSIKKTVADMGTQQATMTEHQKNIDLRVNELEIENREYWQEFTKFKNDAYIHWQNKKLN